MRFILLFFTLFLIPHLTLALQCQAENKAFFNLDNQFGPHLNQADTGRCYAYASAKIIEAALYRNQGQKSVSVDPDLLAADYYAFTHGSIMLESLQSNLANKSPDLFSGGDHADIFKLLTNKEISLFTYSTHSLPATQLKTCTENTLRFYSESKNHKKTQAYLKDCMSGIHKALKKDASAIQNIPSLETMDVYDTSHFGGCTDHVLSQNLDASLCQNIPLITSLEVPYDPGDSENPYPINVYEVSSQDLKKLSTKTAENLDEKKFSRLNTNMMKHAIIVSGKITLGQSSYYILKNSFSAEYALLAESDVCSLSHAQVLVSPTEAKQLKQILTQIRNTAELKKSLRRKPTRIDR